MAKANFTIHNSQFTLNNQLPVIGAATCQTLNEKLMINDKWKMKNAYGGSSGG